MKNLIPALFVLAFAAPSVQAQSTERHCIECGSIAASPADMRLGSSAAGAVASAPADNHGYLYGSGWNSTAAGSMLEAHIVPPAGNQSVVSGTDKSNTPEVLGSGNGAISSR